MSKKLMLQEQLSTAPQHSYPEWLESARAAFNVAFLKATPILDCPGPLYEPTHLAIDLGRRIRPSLYFAFWYTITKEYPKNANIMPGVGIEYFHAASIIVDDIADGELRRRDKRPIYREFGKDIAVLTAHFLTAAGYKALTKSECSNLLVDKWTTYYSRACVGQAHDYVRVSSVSIQEQQRRSLQKTISFFTFVGDAIDTLQGTNYYCHLFSILGKVFQIGNDVFDLLEFEKSQRHSCEEHYKLRLSYLVPTLIKQKVIREKDLFKVVSFDAFVQIARAARSVLPPTRELLSYQGRLAKRQVSALSLPPLQKTMAYEFIDHCFMRSFWHHNHNA